MINRKNTKISLLSCAILLSSTIAIAEDTSKVHKKHDISNSIEVNPNLIEMIDGKEIQEIKIKNTGKKREIVSIGLVNWKQKNGYLKGGKVIAPEDVLITSSEDLFTQLPKQISVEEGTEKTLILIKDKDKQNRKLISLEYKLLVGNHFSSIEVPIFNYKNTISTENFKERVVVKNKIQKGNHFLEIKNKNIQALHITGYKINNVEQVVDLYLLPQVIGYIEVEGNQESVELNTNKGIIKIDVK